MFSLFRGANRRTTINGIARATLHCHQKTPFPLSQIALGQAAAVVITSTSQVPRANVSTPWVVASYLRQYVPFRSLYCLQERLQLGYASS